MTAFSISIVIVNYNSGARLAKCLKAIGSQTFRDFEVLVFDNGSSDESLTGLPDDLPLTIIRSGENLGFAAGNNRAVEQASGDWIAFLNPDAYPAPDWLEALMAATERYPHIDAFGSTQVDADNRDILDGAGDAYHVFGIAWRGGFGQSVETAPPTGTCFAPCAAAALYRRSVFVDLGGFDERFFCYGEDVDLGFRLRLAGGEVVQLREAVVYHEGSGITGRYSPFTVYHGNRNRIWGWFLNMPLRFAIPLLPFQVAASAYLLVRAMMTGSGGAYARAMRDGYGQLPTILKTRGPRQRNRKVTIAGLAKALTWSPMKVSTRAVTVRPIERTDP